MKKRTRLVAAGLFLLFSSLSVAAQIEDKGKFDTWTKDFARAHHLSAVTHLRQVRASRQKNFDRVEFEFDSAVPNYLIHYLTSRFYTDDDEQRRRIRIAGNAFLQIEMFQIPYDERQDEFAQRKGFAPVGKLRMPSLREIEDKGLFEGSYIFLLGRSSRNVFRVTELSNPARLVVDLKH